MADYTTISGSVDVSISTIGNFVTAFGIIATRLDEQNQILAQIRDRVSDIVTEKSSDGDS